MISLVTSSCDRENFLGFASSVEQTIGLPHEIIKIENPGIMSICAAYNKGAASAKYPYVCFVHDDVKFITTNWGQNLLSHFQSDKNAGIIGVAGSICKSKMPASWWQPCVNAIEPKRMNINQKFKYLVSKPTQRNINIGNELRSHVATLDGVFLAVKKAVWKQHRFDEMLLKNFHGYDIDFSLNIGQTRNNYVVYDILMEHASEGSTNIHWFESVFKVHRKWKKILPVVKAGNITEKELSVIDRYWFDYLLSLKVDKKDKWEKFRLCVQLLPLLGRGNIRLNDIKRYKILLQQ